MPSEHFPNVSCSEAELKPIPKLGTNCPAKFGPTPEVMWCCSVRMGTRTNQRLSELLLRFCWGLDAFLGNSSCLSLFGLWALSQRAFPMSRRCAEVWQHRVA